MNRVVRKTKIPFIVTFGAFIVSSVALFFIPFMQCLPEKAESAISFLSAFMFWIGIIIGCVSFKYIDKVLHRYMESFADDINFQKQKLPGIFSFSTKPFNILTYIIIIVGFVLMVSDMIFHYISQLVMFPIISIVFFSFVTHCITDGRNYKFYKKIRKEWLKGYELQK